MESSWLVTEPDGKTRTVEFTDKHEITLGRAGDNDLCFPSDTSISRKHMLLDITGGNWFVSDLESKNGTRVNGNPIQGKWPIRPGDKITAGRISLSLIGDGTTDAAGVCFVPGSTEESVGSETLFTNLEGLLSENRAPSKSGVPFVSSVIETIIQANQELMAHRPLPELFEIILDLSIKAVAADRGVIMTLSGEELVPRAFHGKGFNISTTIRDRVVKEKVSLLVRDLGMDESLRAQHSLSGRNIQGIMAVPLQTDRDVIGLVYVDSTAPDRIFRQDDLNLLTILANVAAMRIRQEELEAIERREKILERDLNQAAEIQSNLLPSTPPDLEGLDLAGYNSACLTVGGDYYDFIPYGDRGLGFVLGDVAGKGMPAALLMTGLQARVRMLSERKGDLAEMMSELDRSIASGCPGNRFVSLVWCFLDSSSGELEYCNAGHNPPVIVRHDGKVELLPGGGTMLGIFPALGYEAGKTVLAPGDLLVIYSDGVTEAMNTAGEEYGEERYVDLLRSMPDATAATVVEKTNAALDSWMGDESQSDDITLLAVRRT